MVFASRQKWTRQTVRLKNTALFLPWRVSRQQTLWQRQCWLRWCVFLLMLQEHMGFLPLPSWLRTPLCKVSLFQSWLTSKSFTPSLPGGLCNVHIALVGTPTRGESLHSMLTFRFFPWTIPWPRAPHSLIRVIATISHIDDCFPRKVTIPLRFLYHPSAWLLNGWLIHWSSRKFFKLQIKQIKKESNLSSDCTSPCSPILSYVLAMGSLVIPHKGSPASPGLWWSCSLLLEGCSWHLPFPSFESSSSPHFSEKHPRGSCRRN